MWKPALPLTFLFCATVVQSQAPPVLPEMVQVQKRSMPHAPEIQPVSIENTWVDPRQQLSRTLVNNAFIERQLALRRDTEKLLSLAAELKQNVDKTSPSILSRDVIKKAQEIEKLAKSFKDKMRAPN